jgi:outer membrane receptor protein involved in Fe transport
MNYGITKARVRFASGAAIIALSAGAAMAQEGVEQVVVSSTRLQAAGFDAPTPTTVISAADLEGQAKPNVFDSLKDLPALQGSTGASAQAGTTSNGLIGLSALGMRALSPLRTLTLMDGQRIVAANLNGVVDVSMIPQMLIQRVDVVTGGASASWGSDAVAGVVNFVLDKKFEGFKTNIFGGGSGYGDMGNLTIQAAAGTSFAGGRGHFETSVEYSYNDGLLPRYPQNVFQHTALPGNIDGRNLSRQSGTSSYSSDTGTNGPPAGQSRSYYGPLRQQLTFAAYGLIQGGPKAFTTFGANGKAYPLQLAGNCFKNSATAATQIAQNGTVQSGGANALQGGINLSCFGTPSNPGDQINTHEFTQGLINPLTRGDIYARVSYDITPDTEIYATLSYSGSRTENTPAQGNSDKSGTIHCDNAYLPSTGLFGEGLNASETLAACLALYPVGSGTVASTGIPFGSQWANILTNQNMHIFRQTRRFVVGGDGGFNLFGKDWRWESYFEHGESDTSIKIYNMPLSNAPVDPATGLVNQNLSRFNLSQDAVVNGAGNIVCRNTIAQQFGCVPWNPFGQDPISTGAQAYFDNQNGQGGSTNGNNVIMTNRQEAFSFSVNGSPIDLWAGPLAVAAGYEYREEHYSQRADPYAGGVNYPGYGLNGVGTSSTPPTFTEPCTDPFIDCGFSSFGNIGAYNAGNYHSGRGTFHVNEVFLQMGVPIINDSFWGKADVEIDGRHARYSTAGDANTWKVGITWETPIPGIRLRALQSRDIRAPNLSELIPPEQGANGAFTNRFTGNNTSQNIIGLTAGNLNLKPEKALTTEIGLVWQPDFIPGFQASIDYYRIGVKGAIISLSSQNIEDLCYFQETGQIPANNYCATNLIRTANNLPQSFANPGGPATGSGIVASQVFAIRAQPFNAATLLTDGFDIEAGYQFDLEDYDVPGTFVLRSLVNHTSKYIQDTGVPGTQRNSELVGNVSSGNNGATYNGYGGAILNWKLQETQSYQNDDWGINLTERWLSGGITTNRNTLVCAPGTCPVPTVQTPTINYNRVSSMFYLDVGLNWNYSPKTQFYTKIDNIANTRPPDIGGQDNNQVLYDVIGRMFRFGVRYNY